MKVWHRLRVRLRLAATVASLVWRPWILNGREHKIFVRPFDKRAWFMSQSSTGAYDANAVSVWQSLVRSLDPDVVVDIGANYGEVAFSVGYPADTSVYLVEANPSVGACLVKSSIGTGSVVIIAAASDEHRVANFFPEPRSSGLSALDGSDGRSPIRVPAVRIDSLVASAADDVLLFKIDVEGHEAKAFRGMAGLLAGVTSWAGIVECNDLSGVWHEFPHRYWIEESTLLLQEAFNMSRPEGSTKDVLVSSVALPPDKLANDSSAY